MTERNPIQTKQKILETALTIFAKKGFEGASTREICKEAGVNISLIAYYFGGKKGLYEKVVESIVKGILEYAQKKMRIDEMPEDLSVIPKEKKISILLTAMENMIDYFYSENVTNDKLLILFREQLTSSVTLNTFGYKVFKKLFASILEKDENDKEVIFRCISIIGQMNSARFLSQFSIKMLNQEKFTTEDVQLIKNIAISQTKAILKDLDGNTKNPEKIGGLN